MPPDQGLVYPAPVSVSMLDLNPAFLSADNQKGNSFFDRKNNIVVRTWSGADIARIFYRNNSRFLMNQGCMYPALITFKIAKIDP